MKALSGWRDRFAQLREAQRAVYGINRRNVDLVYAHNRRADYPIADDKLLAKRCLEAAGVPVTPTLHVCRGLHELPQSLAFLREHEHFVVKPARGGGGNGILVVGARAGEGWQKVGGAPLAEAQLHEHIAAILFGAWSRGALEDEAFIERRVEAHSFYRDLWPDGLCDVRVLTLRGVPFMAMLRVPTQRSGGRANLHQGGLGLAVALETGEIVRAFSGGEVIERHPDTGAPLCGVQVPRWAETVEVARAAAAAVPLGYLGVDIVVDAVQGPVVLEINARPGIEIQNVQGRGLGPDIERYVL